MKMNFFHLLTVVIVPSCRAYIKGEASFSFWETKFCWLRFPLYQIFSWANQEKKNRMHFIWWLYHVLFIFLEVPFFPTIIQTPSLRLFLTFWQLFTIPKVSIVATLYKFTLDFMISSVWIHKYFHSVCNMYPWLESLKNSILYYDRTWLLFVNLAIYISSFYDIFKTHKIKLYFQDSRFSHIMLVCVTMNHLIFKQCTHFFYSIKCTVPDS